MKYYPTRFECVDESGDLIFNVTTFDQHSANVQIKYLVNEKNWKAISEAIQDCLDQMFQEEN